MLQTFGKGQPADEIATGGQGMDRTLKTCALRLRPTALAKTVGAMTHFRVCSISPLKASMKMLSGKVEVGAEDADEACDAVICGVPLNVFATDEARAPPMLLLRQGAGAGGGICIDRVYPSPRGLEFGVGAMAAMLAYASGVEPVFCGKPEKLFFNELCHRLDAPPERCVLIGDNLESDIAGAKGVGMKTILTLTGVATREDAGKLPEIAQARLGDRRLDRVVN